MRPGHRLHIVPLLLSCLTILGCGSGSGPQKLQFQTEYQAVLMDNGQGYFGKAEVGPDCVTLKDVYYVQSQVNQETKQVKNVLVKRGQELHGPDMMYINRNHILFMEPVSPESQVAKLIKEAKAQKPAGTP
jgi:hypothetical protein